MTVYKVDHFFGFFSAFNANAVKDVRLYKGAFPAKYGGRTSSVVDLTGRTGSFDQFNGGANINLLSANAFFEVPLNDKFSFLFAARRSYTDIIQSTLFENITDNLIGDGGFDNPNIDESSTTTVQPDFYFFDLNSKLSYRPTQKDMITLSWYNGQDFLDESRVLDGLIFSPQFNSEFGIFLDLDEKTNWGNHGLSGKWSRQWNPKLYSNILLAGSKYFSEFNRDGFLAISDPASDTVIFSGSGKSFEDNGVTDLTGRLDFEWQRSQTNKIDFGVSITRTEIDYKNIRNDTISIIDATQAADYGSVYLSSEHKIGSKLTFQGGFRLSRYNESDQTLFEPRLNLTYQWNDRFKFKGAYGVHYQFVNRIINENISEGSRDFWLLADGDLVDVSKAIHYVAGASYEIDNWLFDVEAYYKDLSGLSEFSLRFRRGLEISADELFFKGHGVAKGLEFLIQKKQGKYTGWASFTLGSVRHTFPAFNEGNRFPALHDQLHEFKMVHSIEIDQWTLASTFIYGSGKPFSEPAGQYSIELLDGRTFNYVGIGPKNGSRLPAYHRLDLSAHYKFPVGNARGDLGFSIFNLYNRRNIWYKEYDFSQDPVIITDITYLGFTPNVSISIDF